jgi:hypothetical protein
MKQVKSIVIVGGGSSGWMSAAYLSKVLFDIDITLIESKNTPVIGVGEATVPLLTLFMARLGYREYQSWLPSCEGTIKTGILFENWLDRGDRYWHPFEQLDYVGENIHTGHCWMHLHRSGLPEFASRRSFYKTFYPTATLNWEQNRAPVIKSFAYHLNADLFGEFLRQSCRGVRRIQDDVVDVKLTESGDIAELATAEHGPLKADLFLDCTGFRRKIIGKVAPNQLYDSYADSLFCDRAVVLRYPYESVESPGREMLPYVTASAQSAGWIWTIPLYSRISRGYVYSSKFLSEDDAERELRRYCGEERTKDANALKVKFQTGKLRELWVKNCVAIGLAGGFIEPLESTGLAITQTGIEVLASILDARCYDGFMTLRYNSHLEKFCTDVMHFIIAHYAFTNREDTPFWRTVRHESRIPEYLQARLDVFRKHLPTVSTKGMHEAWFFRDVSWFSVLLGMNFQFDTPVVHAGSLDKMRVIQERKRQSVAEWASKTPGHFEHLRDQVYCGSASPQSALAACRT